MADTLPKDMQSLQINESNDANTTENKAASSHEDWGFPLNDLYKMALHFYKDQDGKGLHLSYRDKLRMVALTKQASHGKFTPDASPAVGFLDVVGNDRKQMWISLGDMSKDGAMGEFVKMLDSLCPQFKPHIQAQKAEIEEQEKRRKEEEEERRKEEEEKERKLLEDEAQRQLQMEKQRQLEQDPALQETDKKQIRAALNQQTAQQFKQYAEQQCPGNIKQQEELIGQLQEQHFQQYMQQVYQQQLLHQQQQYQQLQAMQAAQKTGQTEAPQTNEQTPPTNIQTPPTNALPSVPNGPVAPPIKTETSQNSTEDGKEVEEEDELPPIAAASMWTRKDVKEFKESLKKDKDSVIKVGSGETVTVRVPTHEDGSCLFWEFATDYYDIGFGVFFEWTIAPSNTVSVHVSESSDEEELEEEEGKANDVEKGGDKRDDRPPVDEIIPVYRRDCHEEVYCGSHAYPGRGVYLLKFDNSYSLWRSKTLYYRVYYSR